MYEDLDSNYSKLVAQEKRKYEAGSIKALEYLTIESTGNKITIGVEQGKIDATASSFKLQRLMVVDYSILPTDSGLWKESIQISSSGGSNNAGLQFYQQSIVVANQAHKVQKNEFAPGLSIGYFNQQIEGIEGMEGIQLGVRIPLFFWAQKGVSQAAKINTEIANQEYQEYDNNLKNEINVAFQNIRKQQIALDYYESTGSKLSNKLLYNSSQQYRKGDIGYIEFIATMKVAYELKDEYLKSLFEYNLAVIQHNYLIGAYN